MWVTFLVEGSLINGGCHRDSVVNATFFLFFLCRPDVASLADDDASANRATWQAIRCRPFGSFILFGEETSGEINSVALAAFKAKRETL